MEKFDLTTQKGLQESANYIKEIIKYNTSIGIPIYIIDKIFDLFSTKDVIKAQEEMAEKIIKTAKDNNASEIEIEVNQEAGAYIKTFLEKMGINVEVNIGKKGSMKIKAKFKD